MTTDKTVPSIMGRGTSSHRIATALARTAAPLAAAACRLRPMRRRTRRGVGGLSDWILRDIGVPRSEIQRQRLT